MKTGKRPAGKRSDTDDRIASLRWAIAQAILSLESDVYQGRFVVAARLLAALKADAEAHEAHEVRLKARLSAHGTVL